MSDAADHAETAEAPAPKRRRVETNEMIGALQGEADHYRGWAYAVTDGNRAGLLYRADVMEAAATVVANAELAISFVRAHAREFRKWRDGRSA